MILHPYSQFVINTTHFSIRWYGLLIAIAVLSAYFISLNEIKKTKIPESKFDSIFLLTVFFGIVGARLGFVIQNTTYFGQHFLDIFKIWDGGLSIHGALILGSITMLVSARILKINFMTVANSIAPNVLLAGAIGRWGNFFNQEIVGRPTNFFFRLSIDPAHRPAGFESVAYFHPVFLYESLLLLLAFVVYRILKKRIGNSALVYTLITYSSIRIFVEFWRIDYKPLFAGLDLAQWVSCGIILATVAFWIVSKRILTSGKS